MKEPIDEELLAEILVDLAEDGELLPLCGQCMLPMSFKELQDVTCKKCGEIEFENIRWYSVNEEKENLN